MNLTTAQLQTLKAAILAETDVTFVANRAIGNHDGMAPFYNELANPAYVVWKTSVSRDQLTVDGFDWTQVDNLTTGQARIWDLLFDNMSKTINPSEAGKRAAIDECWKGTAGKLAVQAFVLSQCKRNATKGEVVLATGAGTTVSPSVLGAEGKVTAQNISDAMGS
jgi:hypothetical protein